VVDDANGRLGSEHWCGELFKRRYDKSSANHGVTDPVLRPHPIGITNKAPILPTEDLSANFDPAMELFPL
jgi:hypothetical protein